MENWENPYVDKLIGLPEKHKEHEKDWHDYIIANIEQIGGKKIEDYEIEKTSRDISLINFTEKSVDDTLKKYGRNKIITVPLNNIHVFKEAGVEQYSDGEFINAAYSSSQKSIIIDRIPSDVQFSVMLFHELVHLKSFSAMQVIEGEEHGSIAPYRSGISVTSRDGKTTYLKNFEEAVIGYLTNEFYNRIKENEFKIQSETLDSNLNFEVSRKDELSQLSEVVKKIFEANKNSFYDEQEVFDLFIEAEVTGNLMKIGRFIEKTFGIGAIKKLDLFL